MRRLARLALPVALVASRATAQPRLTDPREIIPAIGVTTKAYREAQCVQSRHPTAPPGARGSWGCTAGPREFTRLLRTQGTWGFATDSLDVIYAGSYTWRAPFVLVPARRDSIARALAARGLTHVTCADSVQTNAMGYPIWSTRFRGSAYNAILFHVMQGDSVQLTVDVSPGVNVECPPRP